MRITTASTTASILGMMALIGTALACGSSSDNAGSAGSPGGAAGSAGQAGSAGKAGGAGTSGSSGLGGASGGAGTAGSSGTAGGAGAAGAVDHGTSCQDAVDFNSVRDTTTGNAYGTIDPKGDTDFFKITLKENTYYAFSTNANTTDDPEKIDTVLTVYSEDGATTLATMDDAYPRFGTDTSLLYHSPTNQTVCVKVEDWQTWAGTSPRGGADFTYGLSIFEPAFGQPGLTKDQEPNNDAAAAQAESFSTIDQASSTFSTIFGTFGSESDVDVYKFTMPESTKQVSLTFTPNGIGSSGTNGNGSTAPLGFIKVSSGAGQVLASLDVTKGAPHLALPIETGDLLVWVTRPAGATKGLNDFYTIAHANYDFDNEPEKETEAGQNDTLAKAETIAFEKASDTQDSSYVLGYINSATDVDYFVFDAPSGVSFELACGSVRTGSGVISPVFALHDATDKALQSETETDTANVYWGTYSGATKAPVSITTDAKYYLRVNAAGLNPDVKSGHYRCGLHLVTK